MPFRWVANGGIGHEMEAIQYNRDAKIELNGFELKFDSEFETISGTLHLLYKGRYCVPECYRGIRIVFAADVKIHFDTKTTSSTKNVLIGIDWAEKCVYGTTDVFGTKVNLPQEDLIFPFEFKLGGRLPKSIPWTDNYSVTCFVKAYAGDFEIVSSEPIYCWGNYDLLQDPAATCPLICDKALYKGIFSSKTQVRTTLRSVKTGYLPGEIIPVNISINNTSGIPLVALRINFIRRVTLKDTGASRRFLSKFGEKSKALGESTEDFVLDFTFSAPPNISPTFTSTRINIQYFIKMELKCGEQQEIKTESEIIIGTKYGSVRNTIFDTTSCAGVDGSRRASVVSSTSTQPPSYSTLSSRRQSVETLPPTYEEMASSALSEFTVLDHDKPSCSHQS